MFNGAQNTVISGGNFVSPPGEASEGLKLLQEKVAHGVFHDSDERCLATRCSPHTRDDVLTTITDWIHDSGKKERLMWLCGSAKVGKSAIAQTIADRCYDANILMASFFSRNYANRCDKSYLIPTIAYQLTVSIPAIRNRVWDVLRNDPLILSRSLEAQVKALIVRPLTEVAMCSVDDLDLGSPPRLVILDGLDECEGDEIQIYIINVLSAVVNELPIPLLFLITSRPEQHIVHTFSTKGMKPLRKLLTIDHCNHSFPLYPASVLSLDTALLPYFPQESTSDHHTLDDSVHMSYSSDNDINRRFPDVQIPRIPLAIDRTSHLIHPFGPLPVLEDIDVSPGNVLPSIVNQPPTSIYPHANDVPLHIQTSGLMQNGSPPHPVDTSTLAPPLPFVSQVIKPTHLKFTHFGFRFLPHTTSQIRSVLPLLGNTLLLIGHDNGLSVLDMFPQEWTEGGEIVTKGPDEAQCREIWRGETVYQMGILEAEDQGTGTPQGVVLAIVGPGQESPATSSRDSEQLRSARMYSLSSLISLARWTVAQRGTTKPLDLYKMSSWQTPSSPSKKHRTQGSTARGLKSFIDSPPNHPPPEPSLSYDAFFSQSSTNSPSFAKSPQPSEFGSPPARKNSDESGWDMVEDLPLRWATDFVPLAVPGSRLVVIGFATWSDESRKGKMGGQLLAIATKSNILLYETPKGERAYRFVKEFYTPIPPRNLTFIQQSVADEIRSPVEGESPRRFHSHKRSDSGSTLRSVTPGASSAIPLSYDTHLSLFVVFDKSKKAGLIRVADSAVSEVKLGEDGGPQPPGLLYSRDTFSSTIRAASVRQRSRSSFDKWIVPVRCELPVPGQGGLTRPVHILTRGKRTHVVPCPLPSQTLASPPLHAIFWKSHPEFVSPRVILSENDHEQPLLQLVAFGENGIEVQEMGVSFMSIKGKGRAFPDELIRAEEALGGDAGFLSLGGNWDRLEQLLNWQQGPMPSAASMFSADSDMDSADVLERLKKEEGIYGWCRKGPHDWRIFWVGGNSGDGSGEEKVYSGGIYGILDVWTD